VETQEETPGGRSVEEKLLIKQRPDLLGDRVTKGFATFDEQGWGVALQFDSEPRQISENWPRLTVANCSPSSWMARSNPRRRFVNPFTVGALPSQGILPKRKRAI